MVEDSKTGWVFIEDPNVGQLIQLLKDVEGGVFLLTVHKKRLVKVQPLSKENLLEVVGEERLRHSETLCAKR